jgi:hypothetical protein
MLDANTIELGLFSITSISGRGENENRSHRISGTIIGIEVLLLGIRSAVAISAAPTRRKVFCNRLSDLIGPKRYINFKDISKLFISFFYFCGITTTISVFCIH